MELYEKKEAEFQKLLITIDMAISKFILQNLQQIQQ